MFSNASGLRAGQFVRASGVEVGKVSKVELIDGGSAGQGRLRRRPVLPLFQATTASIRYLNLIGDRYLELKRGDNDQRLPAGGTIPMERTEPALDLDALIGGFRPLFRALDPDKVNNIAQSIITVFQGQGGTINDILDQTAPADLRAGRPRPGDRRGDHATSTPCWTPPSSTSSSSTRPSTNFEKLITGLKNRADPIADVGRRHQQRRGHRRRSAGRQPSAAAEHRRRPGGHPAAARRPEGPAQRHPDQAADRAEDHRPGGRRLRRLLQLLRLRRHAQAATACSPADRSARSRSGQQPTGRCTPQ